MKTDHDAKRSNVAALTIAIALFAAAGLVSAAETTKPMHLRLAYSAITVNQAIPWISYEAGHFKKYGLDVELVHASSILALQALLAGEVAIAQSVTDACVSANLNGADTVFLGAILDKPLYSFMVNSKIKTPQDLKGKRVGVTRFGATPDALARAMLKMWGLDPATDVTLVQAFDDSGVDLPFHPLSV
jgi:NitT/TauT family transport system substrate-binding protein